MIEKVISGGQTGVDRAALDAAMEAGIAVGGSCPKGRRAEDGVIPPRYPLEELSGAEYGSRTEKNVADSDATLILNKGSLTEGSRGTYDFTLRRHKPCLLVQLDAAEMLAPAEVVSWLEREQVKVLNVAGPRESKCPGGIYRQARRYLTGLFSILKPG
jgi:hypothetical protein